MSVASGKTSTSKVSLTKRRSWQEVAVLVICAINAVSSVVCGALMMAMPSGEQFGMGELPPILHASMPLGDVFFNDLFWPGVALIAVNGVCNTVAIAFALRHDARAVDLGLAAGVLLMAWCAFELVFIPNGLSIGYLACGLVQAGLALWARTLRRA